jgi:3-phosphoshikimate 1-carboxyvinyltransferase
MNLTVFPGSPLVGSPGINNVPELPGDKSISHRAALFAAMARGRSEISNFLFSGVTRVMLHALSRVGVEWEWQAEKLIIESPGFRAWKAPESVVDCGHSATTMRLLAGALAAAGIPATLDGSPNLRSRPMKRILRPLQQMGVPIRGSENGTAPLILDQRPTGSALRPASFELSIASAQLKTCLMLAAMDAPGLTTITEPYPSRDHSERMLAVMGVNLSTNGFFNQPPPNAPGSIRLEIEPGQEIMPVELSVPGDFSSAAFLIGGALITPGSEIQLAGVGINPTRTGLLDVLTDMQARVEVTNRRMIHGEPLADIRIWHQRLQGTEIEGALVVRMIDEFPILAVMGAFAHGQTTVRDASELRYKETDRIHSLCLELEKIGCDISEFSDGFQITGNGILTGGSVSHHNDHRLAMALAIAGLAANNPVVIEQAEIIQQSFPDFIEIIQKLGGRLEYG